MSGALKPAGDISDSELVALGLLAVGRILAKSEENAQRRADNTGPAYSDVETDSVLSRLDDVLQARGVL